MTPYYQDDAVTLYHGDCRDVLRGLSQVGLVLTSPPYNLRNEQVGGGHHFFHALDGGYEDHPDDMPHHEYVAWQRDILRRCWDALADDGAIFYNHKPIVRGNEVRLPFDLNPGLPLRQIVTWDRGSGFCRNLTHFVPTYEWLMVFAKERFRLTTRNVDDVWRIPFESGSEHPAPFPLRLATQAVAATQAALVVDPFAGSGTTLRAAKDCGRRAVGIELSERYCEIAATRLAQEVLDFGAAS